MDLIIIVKSCFQDTIANKVCMTLYNSTCVTIIRVVILPKIYYLVEFIYLFFYHNISCAQRILFVPSSLTKIHIAQFMCFLTHSFFF